MDSLSDGSQEDIFADTQHKSESDNDAKWGDHDFEYPWVILFLWGGQEEPFVLVNLNDLDPRDIDRKWLTAILSPQSRCKHRNFKKYPDFAVSLYAKVHKSK